MKILVCLLSIVLIFTGCSSPVPEISNESQHTTIVTDMAGREVSIPQNIEKIFCTEAVGAIYLYNLAPEKLAGWNYEPTEEEKELLMDGYGELDTFGMGSSVNFEAVIASGADFGLISYETANDALFEKIENFEKNLNIPFFAIDSSILRSEEVYTLLGEIVGAQDRAKKLSEYTKEIFDSIIEIPEADQKTIYYGNGVGSLETAPKGSVSSQEIDLLHIINVADVALEGSNRVNVSSEQILQWDADFMIVNGEPSDGISGDTEVENIMTNPVYSELSAVKQGQVIGVPKSPFSFIARPTGPNRLMGLQWLKSIVYPEYYGGDIKEVTKEFYSLFYHIDLTEQQVNDLLSLG